jgi:aminomethyltransferase
VAHLAVQSMAFEGSPGFAAGTGYTGGDDPGIELHVPAAVAPAVWRAVVDAGAQAAGLGARDTLRLEAGLPLHGHELGPGITPLQAGLGWVARFGKGEFRGSAPLLAEKERGIARRLRGVLVHGRQIPREGCAVLVAGASVGQVTSGNFSPMLEQGIALAFVPPDVEVGTAVEIDIRGRLIAAEIVQPPFVEIGVD